MNRQELCHLCIRMQNGDFEAYSALYTSCYLPLYKFVYGMTQRREETEDIVQETFVKMARNINSFSEGSVINWLFTIARNLFYDTSKRHRRVLDENEEFENIGRTDSSDDLIRAEALLKNLPEQQREMLLLKYWSGFTSEEIARVVGKSAVSVRKEISRILAKLKQAN